MDALPTSAGKNHFIAQPKERNMMESLRRAIESRRKSYSANHATISAEKTPQQSSVVKHNLPFNVSSKASMLTPLKVAIESRRKSYNIAKTPVRRSSSSVGTPFNHKTADISISVDSDLSAITSMNTLINANSTSYEPLPIPSIVVSTPIRLITQQKAAPIIGKSSGHISHCPMTPENMKEQSPPSAQADRRLSKGFVVRDETEMNIAQAFESSTVESQVDFAVALVEEGSESVELEEPIEPAASNLDDISFVKEEDKSIEHDVCAVMDVDSKSTVPLPILDLKTVQTKSFTVKNAKKMNRLVNRKDYCSYVIDYFKTSKTFFKTFSSKKLSLKPLRQPVSKSVNDIEAISSNNKECDNSEADKECDNSEAGGDVEEIIQVLESCPLLVENALQALSIEITAHSFANELNRQVIFLLVFLPL